MSQRYIGGLIYNPPGGFSGYFDGSGDWLSVPDDNALELGSGDWTIEAWVYMNSLPASTARYTLLGKWGATLSYICNVYNNSGTMQIEFGYSTDGTNVTGLLASNASGLVANSWIHVAYVRSGSNLYLFVNGTLVSSGLTVSGTFYNSTITVDIGRNGGAINYWNGYISNVRIVKGTALYTAAFTPPVGPLQAITNTSLLTCAYPTFRDGSSNNFTITVNGNTAVSVQNPFPLTALPNPALGNQGNGVYSMSQYQALRSQNLWPAIDQYWPYVTLMLHGNGTNGAQNNTFLDSSTNNFTITRNGNTTQGTFTPYGSNWSNYFNGSSDVNAPSNAAFTYGTSDFTIEGWFFITGRSGPNDYEYLFAQGATTGSSSLGIYRQGGVLKVWNGSTVITGTTTLALNTWNHIALSRSGTTMRLFLNGVQEGSATNSNSISTGSSYGISVGRWTEIDTNYIVGYVSNFRVVKGTAVYTSAFTPSTSPLTAITNTQLLTCQSNRFIDNSTNNFTITRNGDVSVQRFSPFNPTTPYAAGTIGGSGYFDGSGDYLSAPDNAAWYFTGDFTVECWAYWSSVSSSEANVLAQHRPASAANQAIEFWSNATTLYLAYSSSNVTTTIAANQWYHLAMSCSSGTASCYVNGTRIGTFVMPTRIDSADPFTVGARTGSGGTGGTGYFTGYVSDVRVVNGTGLYSGATITVPTAPLTAITNTSLLCSFTNGGIIDNAMMNDLETVGNAQISTSVSKFGGGSLAFDGSGDALALPPNINLAVGSGDFTIEMWVNAANNGSTVGGSFPRLFTLGTAQGSGCINCYNASGTMYIDINGAGGPISFTASTLLNSTWNHYAITRSGTSLKAFVNGTQVGNTATDSTNLNLAATTQSWIGAISASAGNLNGYIDDFRITKGYARYTANFTPQRSQWQDQ